MISQNILPWRKIVVAEFFHHGQNAWSLKKTCHKEKWLLQNSSIMDKIHDHSTNVAYEKNGCCEILPSWTKSTISHKNPPWRKMVVAEFFHHRQNPWPLKISAHNWIRNLGKNGYVLEIPPSWKKKMPSVGNSSFMEEKMAKCWKFFLHGRKTGKCLKFLLDGRQKFKVLGACPSWRKNDNYWKFTFQGRKMVKVLENFSFREEKND